MHPHKKKINKPSMSILTKHQLIKLIESKDKIIGQLRSELHGARISRGRWRAEAIHLNLINKEVA